MTFPPSITPGVTPAVAPRNPGVAFAQVLLDELERGGLRHVCVCPGSRSTALTVAAQSKPGLRCWSHIDERSAGFFALGLAKTAREPVALICTSGTAAANFHPAVIEAHYAGVPLLVLSADRPPELREWGAGQTIDQNHLYGPHVRWFAEVAPAEDTAASLRYARALASRAYAEACGVPAGPVHLNLAFREPLEPTCAGPEPLPAEWDALARKGREARPYTHVRSRCEEPTSGDVDALYELARDFPRGIISCGPLDADSDEAASIAGLGAAAGWPILADPTSQVRTGPHTGLAPVLATSDLFLRDEEFAAAYAPEVVVRIGATPTSKSFRLWIERHQPAHVLAIDPALRWNDPSHLVSEVLRGAPGRLCARVTEKLAQTAQPRANSQWLRDFLDAEAHTSKVLARSLADEDELLEPRALREVAKALPEDAILYVSNSMPIRDLDAFLPVSPTPLRVLCNRGANGIDGITSSALGAAAANRGPVVLLTGDLAFLHDLSGLIAAHRTGVSATLVVFDNDGGGIFSFLPIAAQGESVGFEEHFRTAHGLDLGPVARSLQAEFTRVTSWEHLRASLKESLASPALSVIQIPIDRDRSVAHHREISSAVSRALGAGRSPR